MRLKYLIILFTLLSACAPSKEVRSKYNLNVITFGDSLTHIYPEYASHGYVFKLSEKYNWQVTDKAIGGSQLETHLEQIKNSDLSKYDIVIFMTGANDMFYHGDDPAHLEIFNNQLSEAIQIFSRYGVHVYLGTTMRFLPEAYQLMQGNDDMALTYSNIIKSFKSSQIHIVDTNALFDPTYEKYRDDMVHPNSIGNEELSIYFDLTISEIFRDVLGKLN